MLEVRENKITLRKLSGGTVQLRISEGTLATNHERLRNTALCFCLALHHSLRFALHHYLRHEPHIHISDFLLLYSIFCSICVQRQTFNKQHFSTST